MRPYPLRLMNFRRLVWPSTGPAILWGGWALSCLPYLIAPVVTTVA
jgi:hypothetical protein